MLQSYPDRNISPFCKGQLMSLELAVTVKVCYPQYAVTHKEEVKKHFQRKAELFPLSISPQLLAVQHYYLYIAPSTQ